MAALPYIDIVCGVNFTGQYVDCSTNPPLQSFLVPFINGFVNALLQESLVKNVAPNRILKLKKGIFYLSSISQYYDLFLQNMTQAAPVNIDVGGVPTPVFNVDYLPDAIAGGGNIIQGNVDLRVVKLYIAGLTYHALSMMGWLRERIEDFYGNVIYQLLFHQILHKLVFNNLEIRCKKHILHVVFYFFRLAENWVKCPDILRVTLQTLRHRILLYLEDTLFGTILIH